MQSPLYTNKAGKPIPDRSVSRIPVVAHPEKIPTGECSGALSSEPDVVEVMNLVSTKGDTESFPVCRSLSTFSIRRRGAESTYPGSRSGQYNVDIGDLEDVEYYDLG